jgi:tetratricopeptide (TPR) repeat protein
LPRDQLGAAYRPLLERAIDEFRESQQLQIDRAHGHINLGVLARQTGNLDEAEQELRLAIRTEPYLSGPRAELANLLAAQGGDAAEVRRLRLEETKLRERDAQLLPENGDAFYQLGLLQYLLGQYDEAATTLAEACRLSPAVYEYRMALALLDERRYELSGDDVHHAAAVDSLEQLRQLRPTDPRAGQIRQRLDATRASKSGTQSP